MLHEKVWNLIMGGESHAYGNPIIGLPNARDSTNGASCLNWVPRPCLGAWAVNDAECDMPATVES